MILFYLIGCGGGIIVVDDTDETNEADEFFDENGRERGLNNELGQTCEGDGYTLYTYDEECPDENVFLRMEKGEAVGEPHHPVDILFVLDTSVSMNYYLKTAFEKRFARFISLIDPLDWRMFFTNAGYSSGRFNFSGAMNGKAMRLESRKGILKRRHLDKTVPNYADIFLLTITKKTVMQSMGRKSNGDYNNCSFPPYCHGGEKPLRATRASFSANKNLIREEADLVVVIISNTDENKVRKAQALSADEVIEEFVSIYGSNKRLSVLSLIVLPEDKDCLLENKKIQRVIPETWEGKRIAKLAEQTGGGNFSICLKDYSVLAKTIVQLNKQ